MPSSNDSASRIREQANATLLKRAQQREKEAQEARALAIEDLQVERKKHKQSADEADAQLAEMAVAFDTLIEFILMNHGVIPDQLAEVIAARQEQRILASLPKQPDFVNEGVRVGDNVSVAGLAGQDGQILTRHDGTVGWTDPPPTIKEIQDSIRTSMLNHVFGVE